MVEPWIAQAIIGGMLVATVLAVAAINIHHAGWKAGFRECERIMTAGREAGSSND